MRSCRKVNDDLDVYQEKQCHQRVNWASELPDLLAELARVISSESLVCSRDKHQILVSTVFFN